MPMNADDLKDLVEQGHLDSLRQAIVDGADKNILHPDWPGISLLHWSVIYRSFDISHYLLSIEADLTPKDNNGKTAFLQLQEHVIFNQFTASASGDNTEVVALMKAFVAAGATVDACGPDGHHPLHAAAYLGDESLIDDMIAMGADINHKCNPPAFSNSGYVLHDYLRHGDDPDTVFCLVMKGADPALKDKNGRNAEDICRIYNLDEKWDRIVKALEEIQREKEKKLEDTAQKAAGGISNKISPRKFGPKGR